MTRLNGIVYAALEANGDVMTTDELADAVERAVVEAAGGPDHIVVVKGAAWTIQHPITERFEEGTGLFSCPFTTFVADQAGTYVSGTYRVRHLGGLHAWERVP